MTNFGSEPWLGHMTLNFTWPYWNICSLNSDFDPQSFDKWSHRVEGDFIPETDPYAFKGWHASDARTFICKPYECSRVLRALIGVSLSHIKSRTDSGPRLVTENLIDFSSLIFQMQIHRAIRATSMKHGRDSALYFTDPYKRRTRGIIALN